MYSHLAFLCKYGNYIGSIKCLIFLLSIGYFFFLYQLSDESFEQFI